MFFNADTNCLKTTIIFLIGIKSIILALPSNLIFELSGPNLIFRFYADFDLAS